MFELLKVGHCYHPEFMTIKGGRWKSVAFPALVGLIKHPNLGYLLFDTGYSPHFTQATKPFPECFYRWLTPMCLPKSEDLIYQLQLRGIAPEDIRYIFISHFHADHIAGLKNFPRASFICSKFALASILQGSRWSRLRQGMLNSLLPSNFGIRAQFIEDCKTIQLTPQFSPIKTAFNLFADSSLLAISLPGHAPGHFGLLVNTEDRPYFLIGDACWSINALCQHRPPHPLTRLILSDTEQYYDTLQKLSELHSRNKNLSLLPSHCSDTFKDYRAKNH